MLEERIFLDLLLQLLDALLTLEVVLDFLMKFGMEFFVLLGQLEELACPLGLDQVVDHIHTVHKAHSIRLIGQGSIIDSAGVSLD